MTEPSGRTLCLESGCQTVIPDRVGGKTFFVHCDEHRFDYTPVAVGGKRGAWKRVKCTACTAIVEKYASTLRGTDRPFCSMACRIEAGARPRGFRPRQCEWCPKEYQPKTKGQRFCSEQCRLAEQADRATERKRRRRTEVELAYLEKTYCPEPGCTNELPPPDTLNGYQRKWCPEHSNRGRSGRPRDPNKVIRLTCAAPDCGKTFEKYKSAVRFNPDNRYYCSAECQYAGRRERSVRYYTCQWEPCGKRFRAERAGVNKFCSKECLNEWQRRDQTERVCQNPACGTIFRKPQGDPDTYCSRECWTAARQTPVGARKRTSDGYILVYDPNNLMAHQTGWVMEHRKVIGDLLGRPLLPGEEVHHRFERDDNRPEALELWDKSHPAGQRVEERYRFYKEWIERVERERPLLEAAGVTFHEEADAS